MSGDLTSRLIVRLIDGVSVPAAKAAVALRGLLGVSEKAAVAGRGTMIAAQRDLGLLNRGVQRVTSSAAMPIGMLGALGARTVYQYEKVGNAMQAVSGITDDQRKQVENLAVALNEKFPAALGDIMGGAFELGRAGLDHEQILGGLEGALQLSLAGDLAIDEAADISTNILTAMRLPAKGAEQVAASLQKVNDVLTYVATNSNTDVRLMGETLKYVGPIAAAAGMSLERVGAASMIMASNGLRGSEAGVAMRSALVRMVRPTKPAIAALERLGLSMSDFVKGGRQISGQDIVGSLMTDGVDASNFVKEIDAALADPKLQKSTAAMTAAIANIIGEAGSVMDKSALASAITDTLTAAGSDVDLFAFINALREKGADLSDVSRIFDVRQGSRLITLLTGDVYAALDEVTEKSADAAKQASEIRMKGFVGDVNRLVAAWDNLMISIGRAGVLKAVGDAFKSLNESINGIAAANPRLLEIGTYAAMAVVGLVPLGMAFTALGGVAGAAMGAIGLVGSAIAVLGGPLTIIIGLLAALGIAIYKNWDKVSAMFSKFGEWFSTAGSWIAEKTSGIGPAIGNGIVAAAEGIASGIIGIRDKIVEIIGEIPTYLSNSFDALSRIDLTSAGAAIMRSLWEGMKSIFSGLIGWVSGIPGKIRGAVGLGGGESAGGGASPPGRARGGPVSRGRSYLVGEHRPEIFTPGQSGYVTPRVPEGGSRSSTGPINFNFNISGADPREIAEQVKRMIDRSADDWLRGVQADVRTSYGY